MKEIFVDTGAWLATADPRDKYHTQASNIYPTHLQNYDLLITTNVILSETYSLSLYRIGYKSTLSLMRGILRSAKIKTLYISADHQQSALAILEKYDDQLFSLVDAISFAIMQEREIEEAFAYDSHFLTMGFQLNNDTAN